MGLNPFRRTATPETKLELSERLARAAEGALMEAIDTHHEAADLAVEAAEEHYRLSMHHAGQWSRASTHAADQRGTANAVSQIVGVDAWPAEEADDALECDVECDDDDDEERACTVWPCTEVNTEVNTEAPDAPTEG